MATYHELKAQAEELLRQAESLRTQERDNAIAEIKTKISQWEITPAELGFSGASKKAGTPRTGKRATVAPKYRDTATGNTWSGRGQPPKWLRAYLDAGRSRDDFLIR